MSNYNILVVDDEEIIRDPVSTQLQKHGYTVQTAVDYDDAIKKLNKNSFDLVITDISMAGSAVTTGGKRDTQGIEVLQYCKRNFPDIIVILLTGVGTARQAIESIQKGAYDYINKPFDSKKLIFTIKKALDEREKLRNSFTIQNVVQRNLSENFVFASTEMLKIHDLIERVAPSDAGPILIRGETGVGKEVVAKSIHNLSKRKDQPFLEINCTAIQEKLLENELFGHEKGSFTDAKETKKGLFEIASDGTLFLDEIGDIDLNVQAKLLKVLESKTFFRIGGTQPIQTNTRIIVATNKNLEQAIKDKTYREDLYYRLKMINLNIPPLRERKEDIIPLTLYFMKQFNKRFAKNFQDIHEHALHILKEYSWPGNVRELKNMIERIILLEEDTSIKVRHLPMEMFHDLFPEKKESPSEESDIPVQSQSPAVTDKTTPETVIIEKQGDTETFVSLEEMQRLYMLKVLKSTKGNKVKAAEILGIHRKTLWDKIRNGSSEAK